MLEKIKQKIDIKLLMITIFTIVLNCLIFFLTKLILRTPHLIGCFIDDKIPFVSYYIIIYIAWYVTLVLIPYYIGKKDITTFSKYISSVVISLFVCMLIFLIYPTTIIRADIQTDSIFDKLVKLIYAADSPALNCLPSIHCLFSFAFIFGICNLKNERWYIKTLVILFSILVCLSTLFIKQHVLYDVIAAFIVFVLSWYIVDKFKLYEYITKIYNKIKS